MTKTREKKTVHSGIKQEEMETAFGVFAQADARLQKINATMDVEMTRIRDKYKDEINRLQAEKDASFDIMQTYAIEQKDVLFTKKKSLDTVHGMLGFRTGTPKLKTLKGFTWGAVTNLLSEFLPAYVRTVTEPAKDKLLADRDDETVIDNLQKVGLSVVQDESFYVEPKKEE